MKKWTIFLSLVVGVFLVYPVFSNAEVITLEPSADAALRQNFSDRKHGKTIALSAGGFKGYWSFLIKWDLPEEIHGAKINSAKIQFAVCYHKGEATYELYRLTQPWLEALVSYNTYDGFNKWPGGRGTFKNTDGMVYDTHEITNIERVEGKEYMADTGQRVIFNATKLVQAWVEGKTNAGALIRRRSQGDEDDMLAAASKEHKNKEAHPVLIIDYEKK